MEVIKASLANLLSPDGENDVAESVSVEELAKEVADVSDCEENEDGSEENTENKLTSFAVQQDALALARSILESHGHLSEEASKALFKC